MPSKAFTLIEVIIVIALFSVLLGLGLLLGMDVLRGTSRRTGVETLVAVLAEARSRALVREGGRAQGVCYDAPDLVLFSGPRPSDDPASRRITADPRMHLEEESAFFACDREGIVFSEGSATTAGGRLGLRFPEARKEVVVNPEGTILW